MPFKRHPAEHPKVRTCSDYWNQARVVHLLLVGALRLCCGVRALLPDWSGAIAACCCSTWKIAVLEGRCSGSADKQSLIRAAISSGHSSGTLHACRCP